MDTLPLPPRPNLEQYKKRAKDLVTASRSADRNAVREWANDWVHALAQLHGITVSPFIQASIDRAIETIEARVRQIGDRSNAKGGRFTLSDAQFLIAGAHGFENWAEFAGHIERMTSGSRRDPKGQEFEAAVDAVVAGDIATLESLLRKQPDLVRERSERKHRATLLHYVAANGVEDYRQKTPPNAVAIARVLLEAGAEVDAIANTYGGGKAQTTMNLLVSSVHPSAAGLQAELVETLLDFGAAINGLEDDSSPLITALAFGYDDAAQVLANRGTRVDNVIVAAALGRDDTLRSLVVDKETLRPGVPLVAPAWLGLPSYPAAHIELAFIWACKFGRTSVVEFLLRLGIDPASRDNEMTALHWAAAFQQMDVIHLLLKHGAPLEVENAWGGTVLDSTVYFAVNQPVDKSQSSPENDYLAVIETLIAAGADVRAVTPFPTGNDRIDELLERHGRGSD
jgi:ankyrin repeat protein